MKKAKPKIKIESATMEHAEEFYGIRPAKSFKGIAVLLNGKVAGIGGLSFEGETMLLFSDIKDELRPFKRDICRGIGMIKEMIKKTKYPIVAVASKKEKGSEDLLTKLGFSPNGLTGPDGKIYWRLP